jgi:hypothetical protein
VIEKDSGLQQNKATQINAIKNWNYPEFNETGVFWLFFRGARPGRVNSAQGQLLFFENLILLLLTEQPLPDIVLLCFCKRQGL